MRTLHVAIEARFSSSDPIERVVVVDPRSRSEEAEKYVMRRPDDNSCVSRPHDNVARLRLRNAAKSFNNAAVKIFGTRVRVRKSGALVNRVNQVRAVVTGITPHFGVECGCDDGQTFVLA